MVTLEALEALIKDATATGVAETLRQLGKHSGEITQREAIATYGVWFRKAVTDGRLQPCRLGEGARPCKWYRVRDILNLKLKDDTTAILINTHTL